MKIAPGAEDVVRLSLPWSKLRALGEWHVRSHVASRRNALVASTALADRRRERIEVEEFMDSYLASKSGADRSAWAPDSRIRLG